MWSRVDHGWSSFDTLNAFIMQLLIKLNKNLFETTGGWLKYDKILIFGLTIP